MATNRKAFIGTFSRKSPAEFAESVGIPMGWCVISWRWIPMKSDRRNRHGRLIRLTANGRSIYRVLRFSTRLDGGPDAGRGEIVLDWTGWLELHDFVEDVAGSVRLTARPARWYEKWRIVLSHPDPTYRVAGQLGLLSILLGAVSLIIAAFG